MCVCVRCTIYMMLYVYIYIYDVLYIERCYIYVERDIDIDGEDDLGEYHALYISYEPHSTLLPFLLK